MHRSPVRSVIAACVLVLASLSAAPGPAPTPTPTPTPTGDPLARFHTQRIRWGECPEKPVPAEMRCGTVEVPLDYAAPGKGTAKVDLARIPATNPSKRLGSLLLNYGGPGASGIAELAYDPNAFAELGERYDLVTFDPRGVGHSDPVSCGGSQQITQEELAAAEDAAAFLAALRAEVKRCDLASGPVLEHMGTVDVARDMDVMRRVLGEEKLDFLGFSYGTRLGAVYAALFPRSTGRMVLDGVDSLADTRAEEALASARGQQRALEHFLTWCAQQKDCVYGTNTRTAREKVAALVTRLDEEPLVAHDGTHVTGQYAVSLIGDALYAKFMWPALAEALAKAERDEDPAGLLALAEPVEEPDGDQDSGPVPADNSVAAQVAVVCADDPDRSNAKATPEAVEKEVLALEDEFRKASEIFGPWQLGTVLACYGWPAGTDFIRKIDRPGAPPMLLIGTRGDPATPYEWTEETAERLGSAVVVDYKGEGHTGYTASPCVQDYANSFLIDGRLPSGTRSCPAGE